MGEAEVDTGIEVLGNLRRGSHFCLFYRTAEDLADILIPYVEAGLKGNEFCVCIASEPLDRSMLIDVMRSRISGFDAYLEKGQVEVIPYTEWYVKDGSVNADEIIERWDEKLRQGLERGYDGLRASGNTYWLDSGVFHDFLEYEKKVDSLVYGRRIVALCAYSLDRCSAADILEVANVHGFTLINSGGRWKRVENVEAKRAKKALYESKEFMNSVFESIHDGISVLDRDLNILRVNRAMKKWYGDDIEGKKCYKAYHGRDEPCDDCPSLRAFEKKSMQVGIVHDRAGWRELYVFPLVNDEGKITGIIEHVRDIDERKRAEDELAGARARAELYLDLMGHDINNINQVCMGFLELALDTSSMDEGGRQLVEKSIQALKDSSRLIDRVRKLQKASTGELRNFEVDLGETLDRVVSYYERVRDGAAEIDYEPVAGYRVMANELLYDVFSNIMENAIKHSGKKPHIKVRVEEGSEEGRRFYKVIVEDDGPGIPDGVKDKIFTRLRRGETKAEGKGLGLYLVKTLVEGYKGRVWAEDRVPGDHTKGARLVVMLPALDAHSMDGSRTTTRTPLA